MSGAAIRAGGAFIEIFTKDAALVRGLKSAHQRLAKFGTSIRGLGTKMLGVGAGLAVPIVAAVKVFTNFDDQMRKVQAVTGTVGADFEKLTNQAKALGSTTSFSASQAAEGMKFLGQAGFSTEQILAGIPAVLDLAAAGAIELGAAADIASDVGSAFGLTADELGRVSDVMAKTASSSNTSIEMMGETFKMSAPAAAAAGQSIEEMAAATGLLGNSGIKASSAGTDLKNMLVALSQTATQHKLKEMGVDVLDSAGNMRPLLDIMRQLGQQTASMTGPQKLAKNIELFGKISGKSALILGGANSQIDDLRSTLDGAAGSAADMAATMNSGIGGAFRLLMSATEGVAISIGDAVAPMITELAATISEAAAWVTELATRNPELVQTLLAVAAGAITIGGALSVAGMAAGGLAAGVGVVASVLGALMSPIGLVLGGLAAISAWFLTSTEAGQQMAGVLGAEFDSFADRMAGSWQGIKDAIAVGDIELAFAILTGAIKVEWFKLIESIDEAYPGLIDNIKAAFETVANAIEATFKKAWEIIQDVQLATLKAKNIGDDEIQGASTLTEAHKIIAYRNAAAGEDITGVDASGILDAHGLADDTDTLLAEIKAEMAAAEAEYQSLATEGESIEPLSQSDKAQQELAKAIAKAKALREAQDTRQADEAAKREAAQKPLKLPKLELPDVKLKAASIEGAEQLTKTTATGSFSARALAGIGFGSSPIDRTAKATEQTAANTARIATKLDQAGKLTFA